MEKTPNESDKAAKIMALLGLGLCALCCTLPIIGIIGGAGVLATIGLYTERVAIFFLIISAGLFAFWFYRRRKSQTSCAVDCACKEGESCTSGK